MFGGFEGMFGTNKWTDREVDQAILRVGKPVSKYKNKKGAEVVQYGKMPPLNIRCIPCGIWGTKKQWPRYWEGPQEGYKTHCPECGRGTDNLEEIN